jgi:tetratricopeptide (TPR) repeat protein
LILISKVERMDTKAVRRAKRLVTKEPADPAAYRALAEALMEADGRGEEAVAAARRAVELAADDPQNQLALSEAFRHRLEWAASEGPLLAAIALDPDDVINRINLGMVRVRLGRSAEAVPDLELCLDYGAEAIETVLHHLERCGIPSPVDRLYRSLVAELGRADLSVPGAAGDDPALLGEQAEVALRLAVTLGQDKATTMAARRRAKALAEAVLAVDHRHGTAREVLRQLEVIDGVAFELYGNPEQARRQGRDLDELGERITVLAGRVEQGNPDPGLIVELLSAHTEAAARCSAAGLVAEGAELAGIITEALDAVRAECAADPDLRGRMAAAFVAGGLSAEYPELFGWLSAGHDSKIDGAEDRRPGEAQGRVGSSSDRRPRRSDAPPGRLGSG